MFLSIFVKKKRDYPLFTKMQQVVGSKKQEKIKIMKKSQSSRRNGSGTVKYSDESIKQYCKRIQN